MTGRGVHPTTISVVIPVHQGESLLEQCLSHLRAGSDLPDEIIVVDDGSTDASGKTALRHGATVLRSERRRGPAHARNLGARAARSEVLLFVDADVLPAPDLVERMRSAFARDATLDALLGSYDDAPASPGFVSQYKNLMHCFVHRRAHRAASTFWSGCGAIRRRVFLGIGGFDEVYDRPAIEDIELGYRLVADGHRIELDPTLTVKHLKHWTLQSLVRCDVFDRGIPWTELIWRHRSMPNDLNLRTDQRWSVLLVAGLVALTFGAVFLGLRRGAASHPTDTLLLLAAVWLLGGATIVGLNRAFFDFLARRRGRIFALASVPMLIGYHLYSGVAFGLGTARYVMTGDVERSRLAPLEPDDEPAAESA